MKNECSRQFQKSKLGFFRDFVFQCNLFLKEENETKNNNVKHQTVILEDMEEYEENIIGN